MSETSYPYVWDTNSTQAVLTILHLDHSITDISNTTQHPPVTVEHVANQVLTQCPCRGAPIGKSAAETDYCTEAAREKLLKSIMRYLREADRWTAFASVLMKSMAFHRSVGTLPFMDDGVGDGATASDASQRLNNMTLDGNDSLKDGTTALPIVDLPRTKYNRPFLPHSSGASTAIDNESSDGDGEKENYSSKMSVSHQYPYVCIMQQFQHASTTTDNQRNCLIGLDVVIFELPNNRQDLSIAEFLEVFEASFTAWEWDRVLYYNGASAQVRRTTPTTGFWKKRNTRQTPEKLQRSDESKLQEFYLRWAIKEAYTKALGLGMNVEFQSFETRLMEVDGDTGGSDEGIRSSIAKGLDKNTKNRTECRFSVLGEVRTLSVKKPPTSSAPFLARPALEVWEFTFVPISSKDGTASEACACICRGPLVERSPLKGISSHPSNVDTVNRQTIVIERMSLMQLIRMHGAKDLL
eukprot:scaffold1899_cov182-Alexandrium_tamarense.AAC.32